MINVLVIDDSALVRKVLTEIINEAPDLNLADTAFDPIFAIEKLKQKPVDVIVLDIEMPRMDGLTFLQKLMRVRPTPVIILSSLTQKNAELSLLAFEYGAFEVLAKPEDILELPELKANILEAIRNAGGSRVLEKLNRRFEKADSPEQAREKKKLFTVSRKTTDKVIAIGSSTGGTTAVSDILSELPVDIPGIVIVQHMPERFSRAFAERLNNNLTLSVKAAQHGDKIQNGHVYVATGDVHCSIRASGAKYYINLKEGPRVNYHKPSVSVLFNSVANYAGPNAIGVMLTGMGEDGSKAMRAMKDAGSYNIVQDEESSVVWGMPGKAVEYGAASKVVPLGKIAGEICRYLNNN